jgi:hypothetical protein
MKENKYHYPSKEEIRVGWEGEINWNLGYEDTYVPITILYPDEEARDGWNCNIDDVLSLAIWDRCAEIRCSFLTKEQIEAEGWEYIKVFNCLQKKNWTVSLEEDHRINLRCGEFSGLYFKCPDINTFRTICKLVGV